MGARKNVSEWSEGGHANALQEKTCQNVYLHSIAHVCSSSDSHHGQQTCSRPDVEDNHLLTTSLYSGYGCSDPLVVLLILKARKYEN